MNYTKNIKNDEIQSKVDLIIKNLEFGMNSAKTHSNDYSRESQIQLAYEAGYLTELVNHILRELKGINNFHKDLEM